VRAWRVSLNYGPSFSAAPQRASVGRLFLPRIFLPPRGRPPLTRRAVPADCSAAAADAATRLMMMG